MKKIGLALSALVLILSSCSSDDSPSSSTGTQLAKVIETYGDGTTETFDFVYNGNKIVSITSDFGEQTIYTYSGDLIVNEEAYFDGVLQDETTFEYNANQKLIKSTRTNGSEVEVDNFTYNSNNTVSFITTSNGVTSATGTIYFNGDQPYKKDILVDPGTFFEYNQIEESTFDDKVNPLANVVGFSKIIIAAPSFIEGYDGIFNNVLVFKIDNVIRGSSTYTYNSNNMPASEVYDDQQNEFDSSLQYIYN
jgi:hypothetical protein